MAFTATLPNEQLPTISDADLRELLEAWTTSDDLRRTGARFDDRLAARARLDSARLTVARARNSSTHNAAY